MDPLRLKIQNSIGIQLSDKQNRMIEWAKTYWMEWTRWSRLNKDAGKALARHSPEVGKKFKKANKVQEVLEKKFGTQLEKLVYDDEFQTLLYNELDLILAHLAQMPDHFRFTYPNYLFVLTFSRNGKDGRPVNDLNEMIQDFRNNPVWRTLNNEQNKLAKKRRLKNVNNLKHHREVEAARQARFRDKTKESATEEKKKTIREATRLRVANHRKNRAMLNAQIKSIVEDL